MRTLLVAAALALASCANTSHLDEHAPVATFHSANSRAAVSECLMNRFSGSGIRPERTDSPGTTMLRFTSLDQWTHPGLFLFTVRDEGTGSYVEARIPHGFENLGLPTARTCI